DTLNHRQPVAARHKLKLSNSKRINLFANQTQIVFGRRCSLRQRVRNQKISGGLSSNCLERNAGMNTDEAKTLFGKIQFEDSKITDEAHLARLKAGLLAFLVGGQVARCGAEF